MELYERMKQYEKQYDSCVMPNAPMIARLDGRAFHSLCRKMEKPYDWRFRACMEFAMDDLLEGFHALVAYSQSDEITLAWYLPDSDSEYLFGGRVNKLNSILASAASVSFTDSLRYFYRDTELRKAIGLFDCRVWSVPTLEEAANVFVWREQDAVRNSVLSLAQKYYSDSELFGMGQEEQHDMIHAAGDNWNNHPSWFRRGSYRNRVTEKRKFTDAEIKNLPLKHAARKNPDIEYVRTVTKSMNLPQLLSIENRAGVLFYNDPIILRDCHED